MPGAPPLHNIEPPPLSALLVSALESSISAAWNNPLRGVQTCLALQYSALGFAMLTLAANSITANQMLCSLSTALLRSAKLSGPGPQMLGFNSEKFTSQSSSEREAILKDPHSSRSASAEATILSFEPLNRST